MSRSSFWRRWSLAGVLAALAIGAMPVAAQSATYVTNNRGSSVPLSWYPGYNGYYRDVMPNGTRFRMSCWVDHGLYTGNYRTARWFYGQSYHTGGWGYVAASYVINQTRVPHC